jgi:hypothetical protein
MYELAQACRYLTVNRVGQGPVVRKQAMFELPLYK